MSAVVGHLGLSDVDERTDTMFAACAARGAHNPQRTTLPGPRSGQFGHAGHRATSHSLAEPRPFTHVDSGVVITADIRLDNRDELAALLVQNGRAVGDAELALLAYLRWERSFAEHLIGAFSLALFDPRSGEIVLCRDHLGVRPMMYAFGADWFVFGSTLQAVRDGADRSFPIYIDRLQHTMVSPLEVAEPESTFYQDIARVPAGSTVVWTAGNTPKVAPYWKPERGDLRLGSDLEYREAFLEVFDQAVSCRMLTTQPLAAMLSGGLDSSSVVGRAQRMAAEPFPTYGFVESNPGLGSDAPAIQACQQVYKGDHFSFNEHEISARYDLDSIVSDPDSVFDVGMTVLWHAVRATAENGCGVLLTGIGGDETVAVNQRAFANDLARSGKPIKALREMARGDDRWQWRQLARFVAGEFAPKSLVTQARSTRDSSRWFEWNLETAGFDPASEVGRRLQASIDNFYSAPEWNSGDPRTDRIKRPMIDVGASRYDRIAARHGVEIRHPMLDKRFIEFCLSLPTAQLQAGSWSKAILRHAIPDLPKSVAWRAKEQVGMTPASAKVRKDHGPTEPVKPPAPGIFGSRHRTDATADLTQQWDHHVLSRWWAVHGTS